MKCLKDLLWLLPFVVIFAAGCKGTGESTYQGAPETAGEPIGGPTITPPVDTDADGIADESDNCPTLSNAAQADLNANSIGDDCEQLGVKQYGDANPEMAQTMAIGKDGSVFVAGIKYPGFGKSALMLAKFDAALQLQWLKASTETLGDKMSYGFGVAADQSGNSYIVGSVEAGTSYDAFLIKFDPSGGVVWEKTFGSALYDVGYDVALDSAGDPYVAGHTMGDLGGRPAGMSDIFIAKFSQTDGAQKWMKHYGGNKSDQLNTIGVDKTDNVYVAGLTQGGIEGIPAAGGIDILIAKFDKDGNRIGAIKQIGTASDESIFDLVFDKDGNVYLAGLARGNFSGTGFGANDIIFVKLDKDLNELSREQFGTDQRELGLAIAVDSNGNAYIAGSTTGDIDKDGPGAYKGGDDIFIMRIGAEGWIRQFGTDLEDIAKAIAVADNGYIYVSGYTQGGLEGNTSAGSADIFLMRLDSAGEVK